MKEEILVFGAGALSLGFLGPVLSDDYRLIFCDLDVKKDLIKYLKRESSYLLNVCSSALPKKIVPLKVNGVTGLNLSGKKDREEIKKILKSVKIIFTAVGSKGVDKTQSFIRDNFGKSRRERLFVFFAENDKALLKRWKGKLGEKTILCDTVMGRMCRIGSPDKCYVPSGSSLGEAVIAEDFYGLPVTAGVYRQAGLRGKAWEVMSKREFEARSNLKLFAHNGAHAYLSYFGALQGVKYFYEVSRKLVSEAKSFLNKEVAPAILYRYGDLLGEIEVMEYCKRMIKRITSRSFSDTIERGIRNSPAKITSGERLVEGARFVLKSGITPEYFCRIIAAGIELNIRNGLLSGSVDEIISEHCHIREKKLITLIKKGI